MKGNFIWTCGVNSAEDNREKETVLGLLSRLPLSARTLDLHSAFDLLEMDQPDEVKQAMHDRMSYTVRSDSEGNHKARFYEISPVSGPVVHGIESYDLTKIDGKKFRITEAWKDLIVVETRHKGTAYEFSISFSDRSTKKS